MRHGRITGNREIKSSTVVNRRSRKRALFVRPRLGVLSVIAIFQQRSTANEKSPVKDGAGSVLRLHFFGSRIISRARRLPMMSR